MTKITDKDRGRWLCWICIHQKETKKIDNKKAAFEIKEGDFYCESGHPETDFKCRDFRTNEELVKDLVMNLGAFRSL